MKLVVINKCHTLITGQPIQELYKNIKYTEMIDNLPSYVSLEGDIAAIMHVLQFLPKQSLRILVSLLFLHGTCLVLFSANALIQLPRASKLLLMLAPSRILAPENN